jgi:hypothetical protein
LQQCYFDKPIRPRAQGNASNFSSREWERVMFDLVVTHWFRVVSALIGGRAGLNAAEGARSAAAEAKATEDARRATEAKAAEDARRAAEARAAEDARRAAEAKAAEDARRAAEAKAAEDARRAAEAKAFVEGRRAAKAKAAKEARGGAKSKAADGAQSAAATHPGKRPADLKGIAAKPKTRPAAQKRTPPTMRER